MNVRAFFTELKRRNVYRAAVAYAVVSWLLIQVATQVFPFFNIPNWTVRLVVLLLIIGFPAALIFSWAFEITPEGIKREIGGRTRQVERAQDRAQDRRLDDGGGSNRRRHVSLSISPHKVARVRIETCTANP